MTDPNTDMHLPGNSGDIRHSHTGPILGILIIALVIIMGGLYLWGSMLAEEPVVPPPPPIVNHEPETPRATTDIEILNTTSPSDELDAIEADLSATNLDSIDADLTAIDGEMGI